MKPTSHDVARLATPQMRSFQSKLEVAETPPLSITIIADFSIFVSVYLLIRSLSISLFPQFPEQRSRITLGQILEADEAKKVC